MAARRRTPRAGANENDGEKRMRRSFLAAAAALALGLPGAAAAQQEPIRIGILVALEGAFAEGGRDGIRGIELALGR
jgi:branched-chain amino acid transport system substrate-binding protein